MLKKTLLTIAFLAGTAAYAAPTPDADSAAEPKAETAVLEYLQLRQSGDAHRPAMAKIREKFKISDEDFEKAASRVSSQGYSRQEDLREPSSRK